MNQKNFTSMIVISRDEARQHRKRYYNTGETCKHGHKALRYTSTGNCTECLRNGNASRNDPRNRERVSYAPRILWVNKRMTEAQWQMLDTYLQSCADMFTESIYSQLRDWCPGCSGFGVTPAGECHQCHRSGVCTE